MHKNFDFSEVQSCNLPGNAYSSAKSLIEDFRLSGRSLTYNSNSKVPNTVPWGTPEVT